MSADDVAAIREDVIETMERSAEVYGLSRSAGRVYGVLFFADNFLSIPELVERTGYAKSTISNVTRQLTRIGLIHRRSSEGGGRRVEFEPETDLWFVIQEAFNQYLAREMGITQRTLDRAQDRLAALEQDRAEHDRERIAELQETYNDLDTLLDLAITHSTEELVEAVESADR